ncbi:alpha-N-acetylglucosaminidase [Streptomyces aculeolatus]|uniref:alpha-N-acetylglucosaminidase n=1 Tax=Streptomyces aculeolatus TaxID=270689 RepID=UPI001CECE45B|nr:alpha-N-acetylglucosaminidase [Streptomyces aculeolatus]
MSVNRRHFLAGTSIAGGAVLLPALGLAAPAAARGADGAYAAAAGDGSGGDGTAGARRALARLLPGHHRQFELTLLPAGGPDRYRVTGTRGRIAVAATGTGALLTGAGAYLKRTARAHISWNGDQLDLPALLPAPAAPLSGEAHVPHRFAYNDTNEGYTGAYRDFAAWERALDVLALHGVNEVLVCVGTDAVYYETFRAFGYSDEEMRAWIPAPAHQPWWLLQNMAYFGGPVSARLLRLRAELGARITARIRELGMTPVLPGYFGTVPDGFAEKNPGAHVVPQGGWVGFERPGWLDPRDPRFAEVAAAFYGHQRDLLGPAGLYKMDLLHEGGDPGDVPVGDAARAVEAALRRAHPDALWAILGWQTNPRREMLDAIDRDRMLILDGLSDRFPTVTDREADWLGTPYAFGAIWNFGGHTPLGANAPDWAELYPAWRDKPGSALAGIAMMPEGADNNPAAMSLLTELAWTPGRIDLDDWFREYATARYGAEDEHAAAAWQVLRETAYGTTRADSWSEGADSLFCARPGLDVRSAAAWSPQQDRYDIAAFDGALTGLLAVAPGLRGSAAYRYDLMDVTRQALANRSRPLLARIKEAYEAGDRGALRELTSAWLELIRLLDRVVGTDPQHLLGRYLAEARAWGADRAERDRLEYDARSLITTWGPRAGSEAGLHDYANREWQGLLGDFYHSRWKTYFATLDTALETGAEPEAVDWFAYEDAWARRRDSYPEKPRGDIRRLAGEAVRVLSRDPLAALTR